MLNQNFPPTAPPAAASLKAANQPAQKKIALVALFAGGIFLVGLALPLYFMFWPEYQRDQLVKNGVPATAEIISIHPTGNIFNDQPQVDIVVRVTPTDGEPYEANVTMIINAVYLPQFQPGKTVQVRYDAGDPSNVAIEETENGTR
jgi:hypothetical protein